MTKNKKQILGHVLACGTQIMWGATFVSTKVLLKYFLPAEVLFTRAVLAFIVLLIFYPHHLKLKDKRHEILFAGARLFGIVLYFYHWNCINPYWTCDLTKKLRQQTRLDV